MLTRRAVAAAVACNVLEFFDFVAYAFYAVQIGRAFFPATDSQISLLLSAAVFAVGFIARPAGSIVIGYYADRIGRKPALLLTAIIMTCGTVAG
ncbi:MAG: MFS transporter [Pseudomonadota bacterium]